MSRASRTAEDAMIRLIDDRGAPLFEGRLGVSRTELLEIHRVAALTRALEDALSGLAGGPDLPWYVPALGEDAALVAAATALGFADPVFSSGRMAPRALARGLAAATWIHSALGTSASPSGGREAPGFAGHPDENLFPASATPGAAALSAVGAGLARSDDAVAVGVLGWGSLGSAAFAAALDAARRTSSRVLLVVVTSKSRGVGAAVAAAETAGLSAALIDGDDPVAVRDAVAAARARVREEGRPELVELACRREMDRGPSAGRRRLAAFLEREGALGAELAAEIDRAIRGEVASALAAARAAGGPGPEALHGELRARPSAEERRVADAFARFGAEYGGAADPDARFLV
ncbi:MAG: thiamine pyrophosphate-dependent enzyme [Planctomycetota bacterium]